MNLDKIMKKEFDDVYNEQRKEAEEKKQDEEAKKKAIQNAKAQKKTKAKKYTIFIYLFCYKIGQLFQINSFSISPDVFAIIFVGFNRN